MNMKTIVTRIALMGTLLLSVAACKNFKKAGTAEGLADVPFVETQLPRRVPTGALDAAIPEFLRAFMTDSTMIIHSVMIVKDGQIQWEYSSMEHPADSAHAMWSVSKTFTSIAVGFAIEEGRLKLEDKLVDLFPDKLPEQPSDNLNKITVRDLLTMNCGHDTEPRFNRDSVDWVEAFLAWPVEHVPGTWYCYNSMGTFMLSAIVQKLTGEKIVDYLTPRLFTPLGIPAPRWDENPQGINCGGWGLYLRTEDMAKTGLCILQRGEYDGKQVIPATCVDQMTAYQVPCVPAGMRADKAEELGLTKENSDWVQGYGYQMWRCRHNAVRADGARGQYIIVIPDKQAVVAMTANVSNMQREINLVWDYLLPGL